MSPTLLAAMLMTIPWGVSTSSVRRSSKIKRYSNTQWKGVKAKRKAADWSRRKNRGK